MPKGCSQTSQTLSLQAKEFAFFARLWNCFPVPSLPSCRLLPRCLPGRPQVSPFRAGWFLIAGVSLGEAAQPGLGQVTDGCAGPLARVRPGEGPRALTLSAPLHTAVSSMLHGHSPVSQALLGTFFTWGLTAAGAALVFVFSSGQVSCLALVLGVRGGGPFVVNSAPFLPSPPPAPCLGAHGPSASPFRCPVFWPLGAPPDFSLPPRFSGLEQVATCEV